MKYSSLCSRNFSLNLFAADIKAPIIMKYPKGYGMIKIALEIEASFHANVATILTRNINYHNSQRKVCKTKRTAAPDFLQ